MDCSREGAAVIPRLLSLAPLIACIAAKLGFHANACSCEKNADVSLGRRSP